MLYEVITAIEAGIADYWQRYTGLDGDMARITSYNVCYTKLLRFDNALELLVMGGYSLAHAVMMMIPEAWEKHSLMDEKRRAFYEFHAAIVISSYSIHYTKL